MKIIKKVLQTTSVKINIIANFCGNGWASLIGFIFIPYYIKYIGAEGFGLIGIFASLQVMFSLLDSGLSTTLNKELSRLSVLPKTAQKMRNIVKTIGSVYWLVAICIGLISVFLSPFLANHWVQPEELSIQTITYCFVLLSISMVFQFPSGFYSGGLLGLQRQVILNIIRIVFATLKSVGALLVLIFVSKSILAFFFWILIVSVFQTFTLKYFLWYYLPKGQSIAVFDKQELKNIKRFATGMLGISFTAVLLTQIDKVILSKILSLEQFGYYSIACSLGLLIYQIIGPITQSYFPKFTSLISQIKTEELKNTYHQASQLVSVLVLPATFILFFFSKELIFIWSKDLNFTENTWLITSIYAFGTGMNGLMNIPYVLTLSYGWTKLAFYQNIIFLIIMAPLTFFLALNYGAIGGAISWATINTLYFLVTPTLIHNKYLKGEVVNWYWNDSLKPLIASFIVVLIAKNYLELTDLNSFKQTILIVIIGCISVFTSLLFADNLKKIILHKMIKS